MPAITNRFLTALCALAASAPAMAQNSGKVTAVSQDIVTIEFATEQRDLGDKIELGFTTPDGETVSVGTWCLEAIQVKGWTLRSMARGVETFGEPGLEMDARIVPLRGAERLSWYRKAAEKDCAGAAFRLGQLYYTGSEELSRDPVKAITYIRRAAELGLPDAQLELANKLQSGYGVEPDPEQAKMWMQRAGEAGDFMAQRSLGRYALMEYSLDRDPARLAEADKWYRRAVLNAPKWDDPLFHYAKTLEMIGETERAVSIYRESARNGGEDSRRRLRELGQNW